MNKSEIEYLREVRRHLHRHPEISGEEASTASYIVSELKKTQPVKVYQNIGGQGVAAVYGDLNGSPKVMLRSELDALPITEKSGQKYSSVNEGVSHACGHDGHMTVMIGVARFLRDYRPEKGCVILLFQPSEETGKGAGRILNDPVFRKLEPERSYAFHNLPGLSKGKLYTRTGTFASASVGLRCELTGVSSHAAYPEQGINPAGAVSDLIGFVETLGVRELEDEDYSIATPTYIQLGEKAFGISPGRAEVGITLRAARDEKIEEMKKDISKKCRQLSDLHQLKVNISVNEPFSATINSEKCIEMVKRAAKNSGIEVVELPHAFPWSEDFGHFASVSEVALFGIGAGEGHPHLHSEEYDFEDDILPAAIQLFVNTIKEEWKTKLT
ncbi:MAG: amidohydrolase [Balneolaceae bacterium]